MPPKRDDYRRHKAKVFKRDGKKCFYCGHSNIKNLSLDHVVARSKGGSDHPSNLLTACKKCNQMKGNMDFDQFIEYVQRIHEYIRR